MSAAHNIEQLAIDWCASYVAAFNECDADAITAHWGFPALVSHEGRGFVFKTGDHFTKNTKKLLNFYDRQGVEKVRRKLNSYMMMSEDVISIVVDDVMLDASGEEIVAWQAAYVLRSADAGLQAYSAVVDGEGKAWERRGTPMGS